MLVVVEGRSKTKKKKLVLKPLCQSQIPDELAWNETTAYAMRVSQSTESALFS